MTDALPGWVRVRLTSLVAGDMRTVVPVVLLLAAFYGFTASYNLSETDDVYAFAFRAENLPVSHISDPRLMLYHVLMRLLYLASSGIGIPLTALELMRGVSVICAAVSLVLMVRILVCDLSIESPPAVATAAVLGLSYGYWRYAAEAEVYVPAIMLCALVLHLMVRADVRAGARWTGVVPISVLAGISVLIYQPNVIAMFFAFPLLYLRRGRVSWLIVYLSTGTAVVFGGYLIGFFSFWHEPYSFGAFTAFLSQRANEFMIAPLSPRTVLVSVIKSGLAFSHDLVSANWLFGFDWFTRLIHRVFPGNEIVEEVFVARQAGNLIYVPLVLLPALAVVLGRVLWVARPIPWARLKERRLVVCVAWLTVNAAVIGRLNPAGIEAWIVVLAPFLLLTGPLIFAPVWRGGHGRLLMALVFLLMVHNVFGGMAVVHSESNEYDFVKGAWVIENATPSDLIVVVENAGLAETLRYRSKARVALVRSMSAVRLARAIVEGDWDENSVRTYGRDFGGQPLDVMFAKTVRDGGRLVVFDEFFLDAVAVRFISQAELSVRRLALDEFQKLFTRVYFDSALGGTWAMTPSDGQASSQLRNPRHFDERESH